MTRNRYCERLGISVPAVELFVDHPRTSLLKLMTLVEAHRSEALTGAEVQRLLGFDTRWDLEEFLERMGVFLHYDEADLARDLEALRQPRMP